MTIADVSSRTKYLKTLESIIDENPDLFSALQSDKFN